MWYLTDGGYLRYFIAGDFRTNVPFLLQEGRKMLQGSLLEMSTRYAEAKAADQ
jgi:hypothetical protein